MVAMRRTPLRLVIAALALASVGSFAGARAFGAAGGAATQTPQLVASATAVQPGGSLTLHGSGFPANARLALLAGPAHAQATQIGTAVTGRRGSFVATIHIRPRSAPAALVALACHDACRVRAAARFRIVRP